MIAKSVIKATIKNDTAFSTGVELNLILEYRSIGSVGSEPVRKIVVLKLEKLIKKATTKAPMMAGLRYGMVTYHIAWSLLALRLNAASSRVLSNFLSLADTSSIT